MGHSRHPWYHRRPPCQCASPRISTRPWCPSCGRRHGSTATSRRTSSRTARAGGASLTFAEWDRAADGVAGHLARLGVAKGDVVCLLLPSCIDYAVLYAALLRLGAITSGINPRMGAGEVASIVDRAAPVLLVVDPEAGRLPDAGTVEVVTRAEARSWWAEEAARQLAAAGLVRPGGRGLDQRDDRPAQGRALRPRQPGRGGAGHRRAEPSRGPPALAAALRPRGLHDPRLGRDRQRRDDRHHAHAVAGRRRHPRHGGRGGDRGPGRPDAVGAHAGQRASSRRPISAPCAWPGRARRA